MCIRDRRMTMRSTSTRRQFASCQWAGWDGQPSKGATSPATSVETPLARMASRSAIAPCATPNAPAPSRLRN
eukprot:6869632-Prymnesium_polylepis.1